MTILLVNTNPVVSRLFALCVKEEEIEIEEVASITLAKKTEYDLLFVDDNTLKSSSESYEDSLQCRKRILLAGKYVFDENRVSPDSYDDVLTKPFLPIQLIEIIDSFQARSSDTESEIDDEDSIGFDFDEDTALVLDKNEIERIKELLDDSDDEEDGEFPIDDESYELRKIEAITEHLESDGLEIVSEDEIVKILSSNVEKKKKKKKKNKNRVKDGTFEEMLLQAITEMKPKKIKKLLKDAEVTISIKFKDDK